MTTSPFGTPSPFGGGTATLERGAAPAAGEAASAPPVEEKAPRSKLLYVLLGVVLLAALGAGGYFLFLAGGEEPEVTASVPPATAPVEESEPVEPETPVSQFEELAGRNPFAALVVEGGEGVAATAPTTTTTTTTSTSGPTTGTSGSTAGAAGADGADGADGVDGKNGKDGVDGKNGVDGRNGTDGLTPLFVTITVLDVDESANTVDAVVRTSLGETSAIDLAVGTAFDADDASPASHVVYTAVGTDEDSDGEIDFVEVEVDGVKYTTYVGETFLAFVYR